MPQTVACQDELSEWPRVWPAKSVDSSSSKRRITSQSPSLQSESPFCATAFRGNQIASVSAKMTQDRLTRRFSSSETCSSACSPFGISTKAPKSMIFTTLTNILCPTYSITTPEFGAEYAGSHSSLVCRQHNVHTRLAHGYPTQVRLSMHQAESCMARQLGTACSVLFTQLSNAEGRLKPL